MSRRARRRREAEEAHYYQPMPDDDESEDVGDGFASSINESFRTLANAQRPIPADIAGALAAGAFDLYEES